MKEILTQNGVTTENIEKISEKFDAAKIREIVEAANTPNEAFTELHNLYPELEIEKMQKQMDFVHRQFEAAMKEKKIMETTERSETELDNVVGGGWFSNWWSNNWKTVAISAAIVVGAAAGAATGGLMGMIAGGTYAATNLKKE